MLLYDLFKVLDCCHCTVIAQSTNQDKTILENDSLTFVDNKIMYYIVDRIKVVNIRKGQPLLIIYVIER